MLLTMKYSIHINVRKSWNIKVSCSEAFSMAHRKYTRRERLEIFVIFISKLEVFSIEWILLEADTESINYGVLV